MWIKVFLCNCIVGTEDTLKCRQLFIINVCLLLFAGSYIVIHEPEYAVSAGNKTLLCTMAIYDTSWTIAPIPRERPRTNGTQHSFVSNGNTTSLHCINSGHEPTCIEEESNGARRSSLQIFATLVWTLTSAFSSLDSSNSCRKSRSCSPDKLSACFSEVTNFESTVECALNMIPILSTTATNEI